MTGSIKKRVCSMIALIAFFVSTILYCIPTEQVYATDASTEQPQLKLGVLSDLHYYPYEYTGNLCEAYQKFVSGDLRLHGESAPAVDAAIDMIISDAPEAVIITGDLTDNGEQLGAEQLASKMKRLEDKGIKAYVINGNHDINNPEAATFASGSKQAANQITPTEFRSIFSSYGYNGEDSAAYYQPTNTTDANAIQGGMSYVVSPKAGFKIMMIDTEVYTSDYSGKSEAMISDSLLNWILNQIEIARKNGEAIVVGMHHPLLAHYTGEMGRGLSEHLSSAVLNETFDNAGLVAERIANAGVKYVFSGHMHANDIAEYTTKKGNQILDMETGSLVAYGAPVRMATISKDDISIQSKSVQVIQWQGKAINYQLHIKDSVFSQNFFSETATGTLKKLLAQYVGDIAGNGLKKTAESLLGANIDSMMTTKIQEALPFHMVSEVDAKLTTVDVDIDAKLTSSDNIRVDVDGHGMGNVIQPFLPEYNLSIQNDILPMVNDLFTEFDTKWLKPGSDGVSKLHKRVVAMFTAVANKVVYTGSEGTKTLNDFVMELIKANELGGEVVPAWAQQVMTDLNVTQTRSLIQDVIAPHLKAMINEILGDLHLNLYHLPSKVSWRDVICYGLTGDKDNMSPTLTVILAKQDVNVNQEIDEALAENIVNDSIIGMVGQPISLIASGFWNDSVGKDDKVDGRPVSYHIEDADPNAQADVSFDSLHLGVGSTESDMHVTWYTTSTLPGKVQIAKKENKPANEEFPSNPADYVEFSATAETTAVNGEYSNKAVVTNLEENTQYIYRVGNEGQWDKVYSFTTNDFNGSFNFMVAGDPQIGSSGSTGSDISDWENTLNLSVAKFPDTSFLLSLGDQVDGSTSEEQYTGFIEHDVLKERKLSTLVGNHDDGSTAYSQHFNNPNVQSDSGTQDTGAEAGDYWYTNNNVLIMILNANNGNTAEHKAFMEKAIQEQGSAVDWKIVAFHQSIYSAAAHSDAANILNLRDKLAPVLSALDIDVVLMGHDHAYTRSYMMNGTTPQDVGAGVKSSVTDPKAGDVVYITLNSASSKHYSLESTNYPYVAVKNQENLDNITNVAVTKNSLQVTTYRTESANHVPVSVQNMTVVDQFTIHKTSSGSVDNTAPVLTTPGDTTVQAGAAFDPMEGVTATDETDGSLTAKITCTGTVNTAVKGEYKLVYTVLDKAGNKASATRIITVTDGALPGDTLTDSATGLSVTGSIPAGSLLKVYQLSGGTAYKDAMSALKEIADTRKLNSIAYDVDMQCNGKSVVLGEDGLTVSVPIPSNFNTNKITVYQLFKSAASTLSLKAVKVSIEDGMLSFPVKNLGVILLTSAMAKQEGTKYTVTYADGVADEVIAVPAVTEGRAAGSDYTIPDVIPERKGYTFGGWRLDSNTAYLSGKIFKIPEKNVTLTAIWNAT